MARTRKTKKPKLAKFQNLFLAFLLGLFKIIGKFLHWLLRRLFFSARENPLYALGVILLFISFGFVSFNALFAQTGRHHGVFIETRPNKIPDLVQNIQKPQALDFKKLNVETYTPQAVQQLTEQPYYTPASLTIPENQYQEPLNNQTNFIVPVPQPKPLSNNVGQNIQKISLMDMQKKLIELGFYDGPADGLDGPKTRAAIIAYNQSLESQTQRANNTQRDSISALIVTTNNSEKSEIDKFTTQTIALQANQASKPVNTTMVAKDIIKIQKALQTFGHDEVKITGKQDDNTSEALRKFQEMFSLSVTGQINNEVVNKMKEIGLLS